MSENPEPGLIIPVGFLRAVDGDTIEVEVRRKFKVRLRDIDVVEKHESKGQEATDFVSHVLGFADSIMVFIPTNDPDKLMDITSFERLVGDIYVKGKKLQDLLRKEGFEKDDNTGDA
jgi:endonuclease YncB( thermonuclease family)